MIASPDHESCYDTEHVLVKCPECKDECWPDVTQPPFFADKASTYIVISCRCLSCGYGVSVHLDFSMPPTHNKWNIRIE